MKLPNVDKTIIRREKITDYLLSPTHRDGRGKAGFFTRFGFTADAWETLADALRLHATEHEVAKIEATPFGTRYVVEGGLGAPDGRTPQVRVIWFIETGSDVPRLATAYPL
jgi:hypothetical protein